MIKPLQNLERRQESKKKIIDHFFCSGRKVICKYSPITDFENARCRDYMQQECKRGKFCNNFFLITSKAPSPPKQGNLF